MTEDLELARNFKLINRLEIDPGAWIAPGAVVVGSVIVGEGSSIWFGCVVRGDIAPVTIGKHTNVQDGCILHVGARHPCTLGDRVSLGHGAIVHGATVEDDCLIAMRATVLNGAVIGRGSVVGAGAVVPEGMIVPPGSLVLGVPAKVIKPVDDRLRTGIAATAEGYAGYARGYKAFEDDGQVYPFQS
ncbi:MAG: gamma carbonic anhydrase family protein [bacterium]|nr:gamma carbonic anhydrase family protein [bacterium]